MPSMDGLSPISPSLKMQRIASQLAQLSLELIEPIIAHLPLHKSLEILSTPVGFPPPEGPLSAHDQLSPLAHAFIRSPDWKHVFTDAERTKRLLLIWEALKTAWWLQTGCSYLHLLESRKAGWSIWDFLHRGAGQIDPGPHALHRMSKALFHVIHGLEVNHVGVGTVAPSNAPVRAVYELLQSNVQKLDSESSRMNGLPLDLLLDKIHNYDLRAHEWDPKDLSAMLNHITKSWERLKALWVEELEALALLYERFPTMLKAALGPQLVHSPLNTRHIPNKLRFVAKKMPNQQLKDALNLRTKNSTYFSFAHFYLMPYNWCLQLFTTVLEEKKPEIPLELVADVNRATDGLRYIHGTSDDGQKLERFKVNRDDGRKMEFIVHRDYTSARPTPTCELEWLTSFLTVVDWMRHQYPALTDELCHPIARVYRVAEGRGQKKLLVEPSDYARFADTLPAVEVATYLKNDMDLVSRSSDNRMHPSMPSLLAFYMPDFSSPKARQVARHLCPVEDLAIELQQTVYENSLDKIKRHFLKRPPSPERDTDGESLVYELFKKSQERGEDGSQSSPNTWWSSVVEKYVDTVPRKPRAVSCYICRHSVSSKNGFHPIFGAMCKACGDFNLAGSRMSLPEMLNLSGKTALVTGGRVNLGFHTALRLLRCGARVIVSSRYPHDALLRYQEQPDSSCWINDRLQIVGADFRTARDAFDLAAKVKDILSTSSSGGNSVERTPRLDILINNAAQTLTDGEMKEKTAIGRENNLSLTLPIHPALPATSYAPRVGGGVSEAFLMEGKTKGAVLSITSSVPAEKHIPEKSSWVQDVSEIPYVDVITAQAVNAFVPLILIRELIPLMYREDNEQPSHIVNVSSREGIFETRRNHSAKKGKHVHTNMSKAALNMITETEAGPAWKSHRVAMNTVDPGYMSAAPEMENRFGGVRPLGWEDGAGRVLWPVAMALGEENSVIWGRFLKHYGTVGVSTAGI